MAVAPNGDIWAVNQGDATIVTILQTGDAPQGLAFNSDASKLFVHNFMSRTVRVYDTSGIISGASLEPLTLATTGTVANEALPASVLLGKKIFYETRTEL